MKAIPLDGLAKWSPWPARLLGLEPWTVPQRTLEKVEREYNLTKYAQCLQFYRSTSPPPNLEALVRWEGDPAGSLCLSLGNELFETTLQVAREQAFDLLASTLRPVLAECRTVIECGCGYGYNLWRLSQSFPELTFLGGEYSGNAVELAQALYRQSPQIRVTRFNFYDPATYEFIEAVKEPMVVFTCHALEQTPSAAAFIDALAAGRRHIRHVFHFEPVVELHDDSLLGLMRRGYAKANDYNMDLLSALRARPWVRILQTRADVFGANPLNPTSVIHWQFTPGMVCPPTPELKA